MLLFLVETIGAEKAKLAIMVGGQRRIFNKVKNLLNAMGKVTYVGKNWFWTNS